MLQAANPDLFNPLGPKAKKNAGAQLRDAVFVKKETKFTATR